jgi:nucleotide-binding universal stress UspA family protein
VKPGHRVAAGDEIGGFILEEALHRGGMAAIWRVRQPDSAVPALMKIPALGGDDDATAIVSFEVEQMILPRLAGPHVPRHIASGGFDRQPFIVMERIGGTSLRPYLDATPLALDEVVQIGGRVATALHELHRQHVIHFDVKPSNILFREGGCAVLIDYGLARHDHLPDLLAEEFRLPLGTGPYIAPEQVLGDRSDPRSDLFALGVLLYHLATGQRPFGAPTTVRGLKQRLYRAPVPPRRHNPALPPWLEEVILHCLEVEPDRRYGSAAQIAFDLAHPGTVVITDRAVRAGNDNGRSRFGRWLRRSSRAPIARGAARQVSRAPIVMAAVDLSQEWEALAEALRTSVLRILAAEPGARVACVSVLKTSRLGLDATMDAEGRHLHVTRLVELQHWARPLSLAPDRVSCHVLAATDVADAIVDYARLNRVDHIVMGSRGLPTLQRVLGSVSARVVALSPCTVTVVKAVERAEARSEAVERVAAEGAALAEAGNEAGSLRDA